MPAFSPELFLSTLGLIGAVTDRANGSGTPGCQRANWTPGIAWSLLESGDTGAAPARWPICPDCNARNIA